MDRRSLIRLTGLAVAGASGCLGTAPDGGTGNTSGSGGGAEQVSFGDVSAPEFPRVEPTTEPEVEVQALERQARGNLSFALDALKRLRSGSPNENAFFSPYSVSIALGMTYPIATEETAEGMREALRVQPRRRQATRCPRDGEERATEAQRGRHDGEEQGSSQRSGRARQGRRR